MLKKLQLPNFVFSVILPNILVLSLITVAAVILGWVGMVTWTDITVWNKDIGTIFFGSRTGENISLGIGMTVIHYVIIGVSLLASGAILTLRNRIAGASTPQQELKMMAQKHAQLQKQKTTRTQKNTVPATHKPAKTETVTTTNEDRFFSGCQHHFGYLSARPKDSPIPPECIICQRLGDCMVATVYVKKMSDQ
ncbi:MAG: hypothetical protein WC325_05200 [Candidatus Bathyarchaeia archaeon]|jgi:hypothetical protein